MLSNSITMLILSCDKFSDLWAAHVYQLEKYWPDRQMKTYIVTDKSSKRRFENVEILAFENKNEWSDRLRMAIAVVQTEYVFVTLDDYFMIKQIDTHRIEAYVELMNKERLDYLRMFREPRKANKEYLNGNTYVRFVDINKVYSLNLYAGIWRRSLFEKVCAESINVWQFEVKLARRARENNARCAMTMENIFPFLDVVRKGKLLRKAAQYMKKTGIYSGNRQINKLSYELKLRLRRNLIEYAPQIVVDFVRNMMIKRGHHYFSEDA